MRIVHLLPYMITFVASLPASDFFSSPNNQNDNDNGKDNLIEVSSYNDMVKHYSEAVDSPDSVFHIKDTNTFITQKPTNGIKSLDKRSDEPEFIEFRYDEVKKYTYNGMIPASSCLYQDHGGTVSIGFGIMNSLLALFGTGIGTGFGLPLLSIGVSISATIETSISASMDGVTQCTIKAGDWGQVMILPGFVSTTPFSRSVSFDEDDFLTLSAWKKHDRLWHPYTKKIHCVTSSKAQLMCYGYEMDHTLLTEEEIDQ